MYIKFSKVRNVSSPKRANIGADAGLDLFIPEDFGAKTLLPGQSVLIPAGVKFEVPAGYALIFFNKSGIAAKRSLLVGACVIDHGYSGEVHINIVNAGTDAQTIVKGEKIVQAILLPIIVANPIEVPESNLYEDTYLSSGRGSGGFGSSGTK